MISSRLAAARRSVTRREFLDGVRAGVPYALASGLVGISFGVLARPVMGAVAAIVMSVIVFAGSAQFAALAVLSAGGGAPAAIIAGALLNLRFVPMGIAIAPSLSQSHGSLHRALRGQALVDASWALSNRGGGRFDTVFLVGSTSVQYPAWVLGTAIGVFAGAAIGNPDTLGLDAIYPAFFLGLLVNEVRRPGAPLAAALGAGLALALTPFAPAGVPIIAAALAAALGLRRPPEPTAKPTTEIGDKPTTQPTAKPTTEIAAKPTTRTATTPDTEPAP